MRLFILIAMLSVCIGLTLYLTGFFETPVLGVYALLVYVALAVTRPRR